MSKEIKELKKEIKKLKKKLAVTKEKIISDLKCELMDKYCAEGCNQHIWIGEIFDWFDEKLGIEKSKPEQIATKILGDDDENK